MQYISPSSHLMQLSFVSDSNLSHLSIVMLHLSALRWAAALRMRECRCRLDDAKGTSCDARNWMEVGLKARSSTHCTVCMAWFDLMWFGDAVYLFVVLVLLRRWVESWAPFFLIPCVVSCRECWFVRLCIPLFPLFILCTISLFLLPALTA